MRDAALAGTGALRRARIAVAATFGAHAFIAGTLGPWIPTLKRDNGLDAGALGVGLAGYAGGLVVGTRLASVLVRRFGGRRVVRTGIPMFAAALAVLPAAGGLAALSALFVAVGLVSGVLDVAMNAEAVEVERASARLVMSRLHGTWSVAVLVGAGLASTLLAFGATVETGLPLASLVVVVASFAPLRWLPARADTEGGTAVAREETAASLRRIVLLCAIAAASFLCEGIALEWSALLLRDDMGAAAGVAGLGIVAFSAGMGVSRFSGDLAAERFGEPALVRIGAASASLALAVSIAVGNAVVAIVAFVVVGLGLGVVVPSAFRAAGSIARRRGSALSIVVTAGYVGSIVGPLAVGLVADATSLRAAFAIPTAAAAGASLAAGALRTASRG
jgi:MFS family permease